MAAAHHPIVGDQAPMSENAEVLVIPTDVCPRCGQRRERVTRYHKARPDGGRPWVIRWICGSHCILSAPPFLWLSRDCQARRGPMEEM
jgi:hypothetical protein